MFQKVTWLQTHLNGDMKPRMERYDVPYHLYLGSTPLSSCMIVGSKIVRVQEETELKL